MAHAARIDVGQREYEIRSGGPSIWDAREVSVGTGCSGSGPGPSYTPVDDGSTFRNDTWRTDGFDVGLVAGVEGAPYFDSDGVVTARGNTVTTDGRNTAGLVVKRTDTGLGQGALRSLVALRNPTEAAVGRIINWESNLGSDQDEQVRASSSGDQAYTKADRWVVSSTDPPLVHLADPADTFVLFGKGAREKVFQVRNAPDGSGCMAVDFHATVPAGQTRYLLFFTDMNPQPGTGAKRAKVFNRRHLTNGLLRGVSRHTRGRILNWDL